MPALAPLESPWLGSVVVVLPPPPLAPVLGLVGVALASAALIVAKSNPAMVGNAALGSTGQYEPVDAGQLGVELVDGASVLMLAVAHWLLR